MKKKKKKENLILRFKKKKKKSKSGAVFLVTCTYTMYHGSKHSSKITLLNETRFAWFNVVSKQGR